MTMNTAPVAAVEGRITNFLKAHERLIICLAMIAGLWVGYGKYVSILALRANARYQLDEAALTTQVQKNQSLQQQLASDEQNWQAQAATLQRNIADLTSVMARRNTQLAVTEKQNATLTASAAAEQISEQTKAAPGEVTASGNTVVADLPISRTLVNDLDQLQVTTANLTDTQGQLKDEQKVNANLVTDIDGQKTLNAGLKGQIAGAAKTCDDQVASLKSDARKSKRNWFLRGLAIGGTLVAYLLK